MRTVERWYVARWRSLLPWRRYVVLRWAQAVDGGPGGFEFLDHHADLRRGFFATLAGAEHIADFANWRDEFHEQEVRYDERD